MKKFVLLSYLVAPCTLALCLFPPFSRSCLAKPAVAGSNARAEAGFVKKIRYGMTWNQIKAMLPKGTRYSKANWGVWGNEIVFSGPIKGWMSFMTTAQGRGSSEPANVNKRLRGSDPLNHIGIYMVGGSSSTKTARKCITAASAMLGKPKTLVFENDVVDDNPQGWQATWINDKRTTVNCHEGRLEVYFSDTTVWAG